MLVLIDFVWSIPTEPLVVLERADMSQLYQFHMMEKNGSNSSFRASPVPSPDAHAFVRHITTEPTGISGSLASNHTDECSKGEKHGCSRSFKNFW